MRFLIGLSVAKLYSDQVLPSGGVSGGAFVVSALQARGIDRSVALTVLLVMTLGYYAAYLAATAACLLLLWLYHRLEAWMLFVALVLSVVAVAIPAALLWARGRARSEGLQRVLPKRFSELLAGFSEVSIGVVEQPRLLLLSTTLQASIFAFDAGTLWATLRATGLDASFWVALPSLVLASIVTTLGPIPLGLGTFEATAVGTLAALGTPLQAALTATLLLRGFTVWLPMLPGLYLARRGLRR
jgi:glycosyltransferase 2 family protein